MASIIERKGSNGKPTYFVRIRKRGYKPAVASFTRKTDAQRWIYETEAAMRDGRYFERIEGRKHTLREAFKRYLEEFPSDIVRTTQIKRWDEEIGHRLLSDIQPALIHEVISKWKREPNERGEMRGASTLNRHLSTLSVVFTAAVRDWGWHTRNPLRDVRRQKEPKGRVRYLSDEERSKLLEVCRNSPCSFLYVIVVLALSTGMRKAEILNLRWSDIDLEKGIIILLNTKNKTPRRVALRGHALEVLKRHAKVRRIDTDFLFPGELTAVNEKPYDFKKPWAQAVKAAKLENFVFHDLRHSCASYLAMGGATTLEIAEVLGHKTLDMVKRYAHLAESHTAKVVERMNEKIFG